MVNSIEIIINQGSKKTYESIVYPLNNKCFINDKKYSISSEKVDELLSILSLWKYEYGYSNVIDCEEFKINVFSNNKKTIYHGKGVYPDNYEKIKDILNEVSNG